MNAIKKLGALALVSVAASPVFAQTAVYQDLIDQATDKAPEFVTAVVAVGVVLIGLNLTLKAVRMVAGMFGGGSR